MRSRLRVVTSSASGGAQRHAVGALRELFESQEHKPAWPPHAVDDRVVRVARVVGDTGVGKSAVVERALAASGGRRVLWLDHAVVSSPGSLWGALAFGLGLAPGSRLETIRRHLEARPHAVVIDGVHGALGALEPELAALLGGRTVIVLVGRSPETRLLPAATVPLAPGPPRKRMLPVLPAAQWRWLQAMALLGGSVSPAEATELGERLRAGTIVKRIDDLRQAGDLLMPDPHEPRNVRVPGAVRRALVAAAEPAAYREAVAFVVGRARAEWADDRIDFADAARRLVLFSFASAPEARVLGDGLARWATRWGMAVSGLFAPLVPARAPLCASPDEAIAQAEVAFKREDWRAAVAGFESAGTSGLGARHHAAYAWSLIELGRHDEAGRHLTFAEAGGGPMRAEASTARALSYLDRGLIDEAESRLSHEVMNAALKGRRRAAAQARFWLLCTSALREGMGGAGAMIEPFYALAVAAELEREGETALAAFARGLAAHATGQVTQPLLDGDELRATRAALDVLGGVTKEDGVGAEGLLVRIARLVAVRARR